MTTPSKPDDVTTQSAIAPGAPHWTRNPHASRNAGHGYDFHDPTGLVKAFDGSGYKTGNAVTMFGKVGFHGSNAMVNTNHGKVYDMVFTRKYGTQGDWDFILETDPAVTNATIGDFRSNVEHGFDVCEVDYDITTLNPGLTVIAPGKYKFTMPDGEARKVFKVIVPYRTKVRTLDPVVLQKPITYWVRQFFWSTVGLDEYTTYNSRVGNIYGHIDETIPAHNGTASANFYEKNPGHNSTTTWKKWWEAAPWEYTIDLVEDTYDVACLATDTAGAYNTATSYIGQVEQDNALYKVLTLPLPKSFVDPVVGIPEHNNWQNTASIWTHDLWYTVGNSYDCRITSRVYRCTDYENRLSKDGRAPVEYYYGEGTGGMGGGGVGTPGITDDGTHSDGSFYPSPRVNEDNLDYMDNLAQSNGTVWNTISWNNGLAECDPAHPYVIGSNDDWIWGANGGVGKPIGPMIDITYANANWDGSDVKINDIFLRDNSNTDDHHGCKEKLQRTYWGSTTTGTTTTNLYNPFHRYSDDYDTKSGTIVRTCPPDCGLYTTHHPTGHPSRWVMHDGGSDLGTEIYGYNQPKLPYDTVHRQWSNNGLKLGGYTGTGDNLNEESPHYSQPGIHWSVARNRSYGMVQIGDKFAASSSYSSKPDKPYIATTNFPGWTPTTAYADSEQYDNSPSSTVNLGRDPKLDWASGGLKTYLGVDIGDLPWGNGHPNAPMASRLVPGEFFPHRWNRSPRVWAYSTCPIDHPFTLPSVLHACRLSHWAWPVTDIRLEPWSPSSGKTWEEWSGKGNKNVAIGTGGLAGLYGNISINYTLKGIPNTMFPAPAPGDTESDPMFNRGSNITWKILPYNLTAGSYDIIEKDHNGATIATWTIPFSATNTNHKDLSGAHELGLPQPDGSTAYIDVPSKFIITGDDYWGDAKSTSVDPIPASAGMAFATWVWYYGTEITRSQANAYTVDIDTSNATGSSMPVVEKTNVPFPEAFSYALSSIPAANGAAGHHWNHYLAWQKESELKSHYDFVTCPDNHVPETDYQSYRRDFSATPRSFWLTDYSQYKDDNLGNILAPEKIIDHIPLSPNGEDSGYNVMFNWTGMNDNVKARENSYRFCEPPTDEPSALNGALVSSKSTVGGGGKRYRTLADGKSTGTIGVNNTESKVYDDHQAYRATFDLSQPWTTSVDSLSSDSTGSGEEGSSKCLFDIRGLLHEESTYSKNNTLKGYFKSCCNHEDKEIIFTLSKANDNDPVELDSIVQSRIFINKSNAYDVVAHAKYDDTVVEAHAMKPALIMAPNQGWDELPTDPSIVDQLFVPEGAIPLSDVLWLSLAAGMLAGGTVPKASPRSVTVKSIPILKSIPKTVKILTAVSTGTASWTKTFENIGGDDITIKLDPDIHGKTPWDPVAETGDNTNDWSWSIVGPYNTDASGDVNSIVLKSTESVDVKYTIAPSIRTKLVSSVEYEVYHPYTTIQDIVYGAGPSGSVEFDVTYN